MILRVLAGLFLAASLTIAQEGIPSIVTFRVSDDAGTVVTNASVEGCFLDLSESGVRQRFHGFTDTNGIFIAQGETLLGVYARFSRDGHYPTTVKQTIEYKRKIDGKGYEKIYQWDRDISVMLKRIRNQIPMYIEGVDNPHVDPWVSAGKYNLNGLASYDLVKGAFLPPNGEGRVGDIDFAWTMAIHGKDGDSLAVDYDTLCELRMTNVVDGICRGKPDGSENGQLGSVYFSAYEAPVEGYTNAIVFYRNVRGAKVDSNDERHYLYYFRIRTQTNAMGQITNALYGQIHGQINGRFTYYLNPTPNDRNVEFDPKKNLFKDLKSTEQVSAP